MYLNFWARLIFKTTEDRQFKFGTHDDYMASHACKL